MAKKSVIARQVKREILEKRNRERRKELKKAEDYDALDKMSPNTSAVRLKNRCKICGRPRGYIRMFGLCRICFREMASAGRIPGVTKSSW